MFPVDVPKKNHGPLGLKLVENINQDVGGGWYVSLYIEKSMIYVPHFVGPFDGNIRDISEVEDVILWMVAIRVGRMTIMLVHVLWIETIWSLPSYRQVCRTTIFGCISTSIWICMLSSN